jgi:predicted transcriptional regulator
MGAATQTPRLRGKRQPIAFTLPPDLVERIDALAASEHRSRTNMIEVAIREWLEAREKDAS